MPAATRRSTSGANRASSPATESPPSLGHDAHVVRPDAAGDRDHLGRRRHLEVQLHPGLGAQPLDVAVLDVAAVLAQVDGEWTVMPSAPAAIAMREASTGSG
jgi:hypothetical protein